MTRAEKSALNKKKHAGKVAEKEAARIAAKEAGKLSKPGETVDTAHLSDIESEEM